MISLIILDNFKLLIFVFIFLFLILILILIFFCNNLHKNFFLFILSLFILFLLFYLKLFWFLIINFLYLINSKIIILIFFKKLIICLIILSIINFKNKINHYFLLIYIYIYSTILFNFFLIVDFLKEIENPNIEIKNYVEKKIQEKKINNLIYNISFKYDKDKNYLLDNNLKNLEWKPINYKNNFYFS